MIKCRARGTRRRFARALPSRHRLQLFRITRPLHVDLRRRFIDLAQIRPRREGARSSPLYPSAAHRKNSSPCTPARSPTLPRGYSFQVFVFSFFKVLSISICRNDSFACPPSDGLAPPQRAGSGERTTSRLNAILLGRSCAACRVLAGNFELLSCPLRGKPTTSSATFRMGDAQPLCVAKLI